MSVLVISDSHGQLSALTAILQWAKIHDAGQKEQGRFSGAVFLGDGLDDTVKAAAATGCTLPWYRVRGNCDTDFSIPETLIMQIDGRSLFLTHGNHIRKKNGMPDPEALAAAAHSAGAEAALFGHTHIPFCAVLDGIFLLNPGSAGRPRTCIGPAFAVLECPAETQPNSFAARFFTLVQQERLFAVQEIALKV